MERIYLDYAGATPTDSRVLKSMEPFWRGIYGNPGSKHQEGFSAKQVLEDARENISKILGSKKEEIIFTSGGTESNNLGLAGFLSYLEKENKLAGSEVITSEIEHPSILEIFKKYQSLGLKTIFTPINSNGLVNLEEFEKNVNDKTVLVSLAYVNSEIGVIQPIKDISKIINKKNKNIIFHTDASQAPLYLKINSLGAGMVTLDGQKIYGPKGIGLLYKNNRVNILPIFLGGNQERGFRPGTENLPLVVGMSKALEIAQEESLESSIKTTKLRDYFITKLLSLSSKISLNGDREKRIANNINISVEGEDSEFLFIKLDKAGIACATKSACMNDKEEGSYVLKALKTGNTNGLRFTLGKETSKEDLDKVIEVFSNILNN